MTTPPRATTADDDMRWVHEHMKNLHEYLGQWIAVVDCRLVASGASVMDVLKQVEAQGMTSPFVKQIRKDDIDPNTYFIG